MCLYFIPVRLAEAIAQLRQGRRGNGKIKEVGRSRSPDRSGCGTDECRDLPPTPAAFETIAPNQKMAKVKRAVKFI
ncbi:hypothetical protein [Oxynema aestuarii]|uniref:Uncharacterized protein n=1 Tax=Oxynema aestuarii AP17 TaxID=2064643 RepID=A0A6H1TZC2_9CYAN|nr:hypothetical protein [Oxynema aestuarii]QIZ71931.1 hypothetical protein HCG48_16215 [Oxynema aestuarii AP17]